MFALGPPVPDTLHCLLLPRARQMCGVHVHPVRKERVLRVSNLGQILLLTTGVGNSLATGSICQLQLYPTIYMI